MRNLQEVIDMRPGSIYASFGSKEGLFKEALQYYCDSALASLSACVDASPSPLQALKSFVVTTVAESCESSPSDMCMLVKTVSELTQENADLLAESKRLLHSIEEAFAKLLTEAQEQGELDPSIDTSRLARLLQMQVMGLRAYARANDSNAQVIHELMDDVFACFR